jgi:hypothetical protein
VLKGFDIVVNVLGLSASCHPKFPQTGDSLAGAGFAIDEDQRRNAANGK